MLISYYLQVADKHFTELRYNIPEDAYTRICIYYLQAADKHFTELRYNIPEDAYMYVYNACNANDKPAS